MHNTPDKPDVSEPLLDAMRSAVERQPEHADLRVHYGELLMGSDPAEALSQAQMVLAHEPDHAGALALKAQALRVMENREHGPMPRRQAPERSLPVDRVETQTRGSNVRALGAVTRDSRPVERPQVRLSDVGGMDAVKRRLETGFLAPARNPSLAGVFGTSSRGGLLLYGPPGCGKTFLAKALANELGAAFVHVGITDVLDMWLGESERHLHELFEHARQRSPSVLFLDEIDALGQKRSYLRHSAARPLVNQLLAEFDGVTTDNDGLFVLGATNQPWDLDAALRRPGRLDRSIFVAPPDEAARAAVVELHLRDRFTDPKLDLQWLVNRTAGFSGADLAHVCETAAQLALARAAAADASLPIGRRDLQRALDEVRPSLGDWLDVARQHVLYADPRGEYAELRDYLRRRRLL